MYGWIWRHLPGPAWFKAIEALALMVLTVLFLFEVVFPWANATWNLSGEATVGPTAAVRLRVLPAARSRRRVRDAGGTGAPLGVRR